MDRIRRLDNPVLEYAWGSHTALAELTGRAAPTQAPEAELWLGAHPAAPSQVATDAGPVSLIDWIARDPQAALGADVAKAFGGELPFLFKVLAPDAPLSLQTHPSAAQAARGFARENAAGLALDDPKRSFRDPRAKPELICALKRFEALCGLRPAEEIDAGLACLGAVADAPRAALAEGALGAVRALFAPETDRAGLARAAVAAASEQTSEAWRIVAELGRRYSGDVGVLAPLLLHHFVLEPGQALFLPAGELHAYLRGVGVELMANSDNVLRCGLTSKHVDVPELLTALEALPGPPAVLEPAPAALAAPEAPDAGGAFEGVYATPAQQFELGVVRVTPERRFERGPERRVEILLCVEGAATIEGRCAAGAERLVRGQAVWLPAAAEAYALTGDATLYRASLPAASA